MLAPHLRPTISPSLFACVLSLCLSDGLFVCLLRYKRPNACAGQTAVEDCLERVLGPGGGGGGGGGGKRPATFAVVFFEGHDPVGVQDALTSFAER